MANPPKRHATALHTKSETKATPTKPGTKQVDKNASNNEVKALKSDSDEAVKNFPKNVVALVNRRLKLLRLEKEQKEMEAEIEQLEKRIEQKRANAVYLKDKEIAVKEAAREYGEIPLKVMRDSVDHAIRQLQFFQEQGYALPDGYDEDATSMEGGDNEESEDRTSIKREEDEETRRAIWGRRTITALRALSAIAAQVRAGLPVFRHTAPTVGPICDEGLIIKCSTRGRTEKEGVKARKSADVLTEESKGHLQG